MKKISIQLSLILFILAFVLFVVLPEFFGKVSYQKGVQAEEEKKLAIPPVLPLDTAAYDKKLEELANNPTPPSLPLSGEGTLNPTSPPTPLQNTGEGGRQVTVPAKPAPKNLWPVKTVYPNGGAILPFWRIVAYYGNLYSTKMGALGEYPEAEMFARLDKEVKKWEEADPSTPVLPALHYIAVVAQGSAGTDGKYRARMPNSEIEKVLKMAEKIDAIVFLDIQVGLSTIEAELPLLEKYLKLRNVHLGVDPEFSMKTGARPGKVVGTFDAADMNFAANYLAKIVKENNLPPKILVIHRYTQKMLTNATLIKPLPEVQVVIHMDGWGGQAKKIGTYKNFIAPEPVQFTGFKLFYKNDIKDPGTALFEPAQLLKLSPRPIYIQYQ